MLSFASQFLLISTLLFFLSFPSISRRHSCTLQCDQCLLLCFILCFIQHHLTPFLQQHPCSFSFSFISMLFHPSCTTSLFLLCCPVLLPAWFSLASWISDFSSQLFSPPSAACLPCLPEEGLMLFTCKLILHRNLYIPDSVGSVYLTWISYDETIN